MDFDWSKFTKEQYDKLVEDNTDDYVGAVHVGDISIDLVNHPDEGFLAFDYYVLHEETGYGYLRADDTPYDYAEGNEIKVENQTYAEFKTQAEKLFEEYISTCTCVAYSLAEHAARPLVIW